MSDARERAEKAYPVFMPDGQKAPIRELDRESKALRRGYERGWNECAEKYESEVLEATINGDGSTTLKRLSCKKCECLQEPREVTDAIVERACSNFLSVISMKYINRHHDQVHAAMRTALEAAEKARG